ncbi:MAG: hypothetical protein B6D37_09865 [Sphingobacteriales bacterium UTBCD1]|jgi:polyisoprenoid-binding protein YceI|nr:MAG: hypothetical protein B6D37_09865 [Sphingobacteriales bacterium UTBCD1]
MATIKWQLDPAHSEVLFKVRHMMVSNVTGEFQTFNVTLETEGHDFSTAKATFTADIESITTKVMQRDNHLKSEDFFDLKNHPKLTFVSRKIRKISDTGYEMEGDLTIRETTKQETFKVENTGLIKDGSGYYRAGFSITGKIKRLEFGLKYNPALEAGGVVVGNDVNINADIEMTHPE